MYKYLNFEPIKDSQTKLAQLFNIAMDRVKTARHFIAPSCTSIVASKGCADFERESFMAQKFYQLCLTEIYYHQVIHYLTEWKQMATQYNNEFAGNWKYYALSKHIELINEYGGDEEDYNDGGSLRTELTNQELSHSTIVNEMRDFNDIFLTTGLFSLTEIYAILLLDSELSLQKIFAQIGKPIKTYRQGDDGEMIENTWVDEQEISSRQQHECDTIVDMLFSAQRAVVELVRDVKKLKVFTNNKPFFAKLPDRIEAILDLRIVMNQYPRKGGRL
ncbi:MAG: hypothetical protein KGZ81_13530 [Flavobacteriales bacterium]|nr:hypothetical protein [Flavobacteriales bacterium]